MVKIWKKNFLYDNIFFTCNVAKIVFPQVRVNLVDVAIPPMETLKQTPQTRSQKIPFVW